MFVLMQLSTIQRIISEDETTPENQERKVATNMSQTNLGANKFTFAGENMQITYYPQAPGPLIAGQDTRNGKVEYHGLEGDKNFLGSGIQVQDSPLGRMLTILLKANDDSGGLSLTILLPNITGVTGDRPVDFATLAIKTASRGFVVQPGAILTYEVLPLLGTASKVLLPLRSVLIYSNIRHCLMLSITLINGLVLIDVYTGVDQRLQNFLMKNVPTFH
jgi:hypothetical protein